MSGYYRNRISVNWLGNSPYFTAQRAIDNIHDWRSSWGHVAFAPAAALQIYEAFGGQVEVSCRPSYSPPDETLADTMTPRQWADYIRNHVDPRLWAYSLNEAGDSDKVLNWLSDLIEETASDGRKLIVWNGNAGSPADTNRYSVPAMLRLLRLLDRDRNRVILGIHEGFCGVPTSGIIGSHPADTRYHPDYTIRANWPQTTHGLTCWHSGRFNFFYQACDQHNIGRPRILVTEWACGFTSDIHDWLRQTVGENADSWRTHKEYWRRIEPGMSADEYYAEGLVWRDKATYAGTTVEGEWLFCGGHYDHTGAANWQGHDVRRAAETENLHRVIRTYAATLDTQQPPPPPPAPDPEPTPEPPPPDSLVRFTPAQVAELRTLAARLQTDAAQIGAILDAPAE